MPSYNYNMYMAMTKHNNLLLEVEMPEKEELPKIKICLRRDDDSYLCESMQLLDFMKLVWKFAKMLKRLARELSRKLDEKEEFYVQEFGKERVISADSFEEAVKKFEEEIIRENIKIFRLREMAYLLENYVYEAMCWINIDFGVFLGYSNIIRLDEDVDKAVEDGLMLEVEIPEEEEEEEIVRVKVCLNSNGHLCVAVPFIEFLKIIWKVAKVLEDYVFEASRKPYREVYNIVQEYSKEKVIEAKSHEEAIKKFENEIENANRKIWRLEDRLDYLNHIHSALYSLRIFVACVLNYIDELEDEEERRFLDENDVCKELEPEDDC